MKLSRQFVGWWGIGSLILALFMGLSTWRDVQRARSAQETMAALIAETGDTAPLPCRGVAGVDYATHASYPGACFFREADVRRVYPELERADFAEIQRRLRSTFIDLGEARAGGDAAVKREMVEEALIAKPSVLIARALLIGIGVSLLPLAAAFVMTNSQANFDAETAPASTAAASLDEAAVPRKRGSFFTWWGLASLIFVGLAAIYLVPEVRKIRQTQEDLVSAFVAYGGQMLLPCTSARGERNVDYAPDSKYEYCLYSDESFLKHWPEFKEQDLESMRLRFYAARMGVDVQYADRDAADTIAAGILVAVAIPLLSLLLGVLLRSEFRSRARRAAAQASPWYHRE